MSIWVDANGWPVPPEVLLACLVAEVVYFRGWERIVRNARAREAARARIPSFAGAAGVYQRSIWLWRGLFFSVALLALLVASSTPIDILSSRLLWVHMIQHLLLLGVIAPLLVASAPAIPLWLGLPGRVHKLFKRCVSVKIRRGLYRVVGWLRQPALSCVLLVVGTWIWHWPALYDLALTNAAIHDWCEHTTFLAVSILFWTQVIPSPPLRARAGYPGRIGCVGVAIVQNVVLAVLIGFAQTPLYAPYIHQATGAGVFAALQDQHLGAGIMWTFGDLPFGIAFAALVHRWLGSVMDDPETLAVGGRQSASTRI